MKTVDPSPAGSPLLVFDSVGFTYPGRDAPILKDLSFVVPAGGFVSVEGPSGGGKSTLLRLACRLEVPDCGQILLDGRPAAAMAPAALRREVCCVQQTPTLLGAYHQQCLGCHERMDPDGQELPQDCTGCHAEKATSGKVLAAHTQD